MGYNFGTIPSLAIENFDFVAKNCIEMRMQHFNKQLNGNDSTSSDILRLLYTVQDQSSNRLIEV